MKINNMFAVVVFFFSVCVLFDSNALAQECVNFEDFPTSPTRLSSPVVAPTGYTIPSGIQLDFKGYPIYLQPDEYCFGSWPVPVYEDEEEEAMDQKYYGTFLGMEGTLEITIDNPNNGIIWFKLLHVNQPDIEYQAFDSDDDELTSGWTTKSGNNADPETLYPLSISDHFGNDIRKILIRNLSYKTGFVEFCYIPD